MPRPHAAASSHEVAARAARTLSPPDQDWRPSRGQRANRLEPCGNSGVAGQSHGCSQPGRRRVMRAPASIIKKKGLGSEFRAEALRSFAYEQAVRFPDFGQA
jgi:hypothetical protein